MSRSSAQRPRADELIGDVMADLRSSLRRLDDPTQRRIMRTYGATILALPGDRSIPFRHRHPRKPTRDRCVD